MAALYDAPVRYPVEDFTPAERDLLAPHFTNLDRPLYERIFVGYGDDSIAQVGGAHIAFVVLAALGSLLL